MKTLARHFHEDENRWGLLGLIHDADWEKTAAEPDKHTRLTERWLREAGEDEEMIAALLSHNYKNNGFRSPENRMEWSLYTCDELTGLIVAVALVRPDRKLSSVTVEAVLKKFPAKAFAAGVDRSQIGLCREKLGIELPDFVAIVLRSMHDISDELGL